MLVTHFHFGGRCDEAIELYEKAFNTKINSMDRDEAGGVIHAEMKIHGQRVMLNDFYGGKDNNPENFSIQMVPIFKTKEQLLRCYEVLKTGAISVSLPHKTFHSPLVAGVIDKFGIKWGLMVEEDIAEW